MGRNVDVIYSLDHEIRSVVRGDNIPCNWNCAALILSNHDKFPLYKALEGTAQAMREDRKQLIEYSVAGSQCLRSETPKYASAGVYPECMTSRIVPADELNSDLRVNRLSSIERISKN